MKDTKEEKRAFEQLPCGRNSMWVQCMIYRNYAIQGGVQARCARRCHVYRLRCVTPFKTGAAAQLIRRQRRLFAAVFPDFWTDQVIDPTVSDLLKSLHHWAFGLTTTFKVGYSRMAPPSNSCFHIDFPVLITLHACMSKCVHTLWKENDLIGEAKLWLDEFISDGLFVPVTELLML